MASLYLPFLLTLFTIRGIEVSNIIGSEIGEGIKEGIKDVITGLIDYFSRLIEYLVKVILSFFHQVIQVFTSGPMGYLIPIGLALAAIVVLILWRGVKVLIDLVPFW